MRRNPFRIPINVIIFLIIVVPVFPQRISFHYIPPPKINPWAIVTSITQDTQGFMWFGGNGIHRYDGIHVVTYRNDPLNPNSLLDNAVETLFADDNNQLWIGTQGAGMDCFNTVTKTFTHYRHQEGNDNSLSSGMITAITKDREGYIWIGTEKGLDRLDPKNNNFIHYRHNEHDSASLSNNVVRAIYVDSRDVIWVGTGSPFHSDGEINSKAGGLNSLDKKTNKFTRFLHHDDDPTSLVDNRVRAIYEDSRGTFWVGTAGDGLHSLDKVTGKFTRYPYDPFKISRSPVGSKFSWVDDHITFIREDAVGSLWIGTMMGGMTQYDPKSGKVIRYGAGMDSAKQFPDNSAWAAYSSRDGNFWVSTWEAGIYMVNPFEQNFPYIKTGEHVDGIYKGANAETWICTHTGLTKIDASKRSKKYFIDMSARRTNDNIHGFLRDRTGIFWIASDEGLISFNPLNEKIERYTHDDANSKSLSHGVVLTLKEDHKGDLWIGPMDGLDKMDRETGAFVHYKDETKSDNTLNRKIIMAVLEDRNHHLWIGNHDGIHLIDPNTRVVKNYLKGTTVFAIFEDTDRTLWVGSSDGLFRYDPITGSFKVFLDPASGLGFKNVGFIFEDVKKRLWINSSGGYVSRLNRQRDSSNTFEESFGLKDLQSGGVQLNSPDRKIFLSDSTGYYDISLDQLSGNFIPPNVAFTDFRLGEQSLLAFKNAILPNGLSPAKTIYLNYRQNVFSFDFEVLHFSNPQNNQCLYKLENYDDKWRQPGAERRASYFNVPPGHYTFRVKAANSNGIWVEKDIAIVISPPWWRTWWAYSLFGIILLTAIWAFIAYRSRKFRIENRILEEKVAQRTRELQQSLEDLKSTQAQLILKEKMASLGELTAGIAHEIQNPLNFVNNFSEVSNELITEMNTELDQSNISEAKFIAADIKQNLEKINHHGKRADAIVKAMLQHSRSTSGRNEPTDINGLADEYLRLSYHRVRAKEQAFIATLNTDFDESIGKINIIPQDIGRVLLNLLNNAFDAVHEKKKQTGDQFEPAVLLSTRSINGKVEIAVKDNGNGIPASIVDKIFQPFFTTKPTGQGTGLGLSLAYDIIKAHGGEIRVSSVEGAFTEFIVELPA